MSKKKATLVINPHAGQNVARLSDILAVLTAGGWKTQVTLKEYGGHSIELARGACEDDGNLLIAYGGDGTLSQVVNGVMSSGEQGSAVTVIPGGTANLWAREIGLPADPLKASLALLCAEQRAIDVGYVAVESITFADGTTVQIEKHSKGKTRRRKQRGRTKHHFLLMAGLGADAAVIGGVSKALKYRVGPLAVGLSMMKELPAQPTFPVEVRAVEHGEDKLLWQGEALQMVIGNTRRYAIVTEMTPDASIDDGLLDLCIITAGSPLSTAQQVAALVLRRKPDTTVSSYFQQAHFRITIPSSIQMELDGSAVKLKDYLDKEVYEQVLERASAEQVMVTYRIDVVPHAIHMLVPSTCDNQLFSEVQAEQAVAEETEESAHEKKQVAEESRQVRDSESGTIPGSLIKGRQVTVIGSALQTGKKQTLVIAGTTPKLATGDLNVVAIVVNKDTVLHNQEDNTLHFEDLSNIKEGTVITVEGKKSKRGVIHATAMLI